MTHALTQVEIPKRSLYCFTGGERLVAGMEYYSLLVAGENEKIVRRDFCLTCWHQFSVEADLSSCHGYWKSCIDTKQASDGQEKSKVAKALSLLKHLLQEPEQRESEVFVLALFLARARRLILRQEISREGQIYFLYEVAHQEEFVTVKQHSLSELEISHIQKSLANKLT